MKNLISSILFFTFLFGIAPVCYCSPECCKTSDISAKLPDWILKWRTPGYGLEFQGEVKIVTGDDLKKELNARDKISVIDENSSSVHKEMKKKVDQYFKAQSKQSKADFEINEMDPIEYFHEDKKMWLILKNIKFKNLNSYDKKPWYRQNPEVQLGAHYIPRKRFDEIIKTHDPGSDKYKEPAEDSTDDVLYYRRDVSWTINLSGGFLKEDKKVNAEADFQIQPAFGEGDGLRKSGTVKFTLGRFTVNIKFVVKHIDDYLRPFLDDKIRSDNRVPDFDADYELLDGISIDEIKLTKYKGDVKKWGIPEQPENVNEKMPLANNQLEPSQDTLIPIVDQEEDLENDAKMYERVKKHFAAVINLIEKHKDIVKQKLCVNIMPKITWKIMKMLSKLQLQSLVYEVMKYESNFDPRSELAPVDANLAKRLGALFGFTMDKVGSWVNNVCGGWWNRNK